MIVSLDTETTGTDPQRHEAWEVALVREGDEACWQFPIDLSFADPSALAVGGFYSRTHCLFKTTTAWQEWAWQEWDNKLVPANEAVRRIAELTEGATLLGCNVAWDAAILRRLLQRYGFEAAWSHRMLDLGSFVAGCWGAKKPLSSKAISDRIPNDAVHTALGDARWNMAVYHRMIGHL